MQLEAHRKPALFALLAAQVVVAILCIIRVRAVSSWPMRLTVSVLSLALGLLAVLTTRAWGINAGALVLLFALDTAYAGIGMISYWATEPPASTALMYTSAATGFVNVAAIALLAWRMFSG